MFTHYKDLFLFLLVTVLLISAGCAGYMAHPSGPLPVSSGILFRLSYPNAERVSIAGSFNHWDPMTHVLSENTEGEWRIVIPIPPGRYHYMFVVDDTVWIPDPGSELTIRDGFGHRNSILVVE